MSLGRLSLVSCSLLVALPSVAWAGDGTARPPRIPARNEVLPAYQTSQEIETNRLETLNNATNAPGSSGYPWTCDAADYGFSTARPNPNVRFLTESDLTSGVLLGWPSYGCQVVELTDILRNSINQTPQVTVTVLVAPADQAAAQSCLTGRGFSANDLAQITWQPIPVDSIWLRDYGPEVLYDTTDPTVNVPVLIDGSYYPSFSSNCSVLQGRPRDDVSPTRLAQAWGAPVFRPQLRMEGGNLQTDGNGRCFRLRRQTLTQNQFGRAGAWVYDENTLNSRYVDYYNCSEVVVLESQQGGVIDHLDMVLSFISPTRVVVGQYDPTEDPTNAAILDYNAAKLTSLGYTVLRIPMPPVYCRLDNAAGGSCLAPMTGTTRTCTTPLTHRVWATYANNIRIGNKLLVPSYSDVPATLSAAQTARANQARDVYQQALDDEFGPGAVQVVMIDSSNMIDCQGSFHCVTITH